MIGDREFQMQRHNPEVLYAAGYPNRAVSDKVVEDEFNRTYAGRSTVSIIAPGIEPEDVEGVHAAVDPMTRPWPTQIVRGRNKQQFLEQTKRGGGVARTRRDGNQVHRNFTKTTWKRSWPLGETG